ncbi:MAG: hypothetical protein D6732_24445 [Methanobacteriota archaeon]|nr:MAG: hypothetical protein D6732_24445 [Euryarchaeota archaeon]
MLEGRYGVALFDDGGKSSGIASISGGDAIRFSLPVELPQDVTWLTNLQFRDLMSMGMLHGYRYKPSSFLRSSMDAIAAEIGLPKDGYKDYFARTMSEIFNRVMTYSDALYDFQDLNDSELRTLLRRHLPVEKDARTYDFGMVNNALKGAYQTSQRIEGRPPKNTQWHALRFARVEYFATLMRRIQVPAGTWKPLKIQGDKMKYLIKNIDEKPMICRIKIKKVKDPELAMLFAFGSGASAPRSWAPAHEIMMLSQIMDLEIGDIVVGDGYRSIEIDFPPQSIIDQLSISIGLIYENLYAAMVCKSESIPSPRAIWMSAWDRIYCARAAVSLYKNGFYVNGFGYGAIYVNVFDEQLEDLVETAIGLGLEPSTRLIQLINGER